MNPQFCHDTKVKIAAGQFHVFLSSFDQIAYCPSDKFCSAIECKLFKRYESITGFTFPITKHDVAL